MDAKISGILTALEPIFGVFLAVLLLNEEVSLVSALGIIIIVVSALGVKFYYRNGYIKKLIKRKRRWRGFKFA